MHAYLRPLAELSEKDELAWRRLAAGAAEPNPFFEPELLLPAWRHLGPPDVALLVAADDDGWAACLPVHRPARWRRLPLAPLAAWRNLYCFLGTPLVAKSRLESALGCLIDRGVRERRSATLVLDWLGDGGPVAAALPGVLAQRGLRAAGYERFDRAALRRRAEPTYLDETLTGHRRRELQRLGRALGRELGGEVTVSDRAADPAAYDDFLRLEASGWKGEEGTALASRESHAAFFRDVCSGFARSGRLELLELAGSGRPVAMKCNVLAGTTAFCFKIAYDPAFARFSPGVQLERATVDHFHQGELSSMDSCADPDNLMINRLWPDRRPITTLLLASAGPLGWAARRGTTAAAAVRDRVRRVQWQTS